MPKLIIIIVRIYRWSNACVYNHGLFYHAIKGAEVTYIHKDSACVYIYLVPCKESLKWYIY